MLAVQFNIYDLWPFSGNDKSFFAPHQLSNLINNLQPMKEEAFVQAVHCSGLSGDSITVAQVWRGLRDTSAVEARDWVSGSSDTAGARPQSRGYMTPGHSVVMMLWCDWSVKDKSECWLAALIALTTPPTTCCFDVWCSILAREYRIFKDPQAGRILFQKKMTTCWCSIDFFTPTVFFYTKDIAFLVSSELRVNMRMNTCECFRDFWISFRLYLRECKNTVKFQLNQMKRQKSLTNLIQFHLTQQLLLKTLSFSLPSVLLWRMKVQC